MKEPETILAEFESFVSDKVYPCVAARAAMSRGHVPCYIAADMRNGEDDKRMLEFIYNFIAQFRGAKDSLHSAAVIFKAPLHISEQRFEDLFWQRLQALSNLDAEHFRYDHRVSADTTDHNFSFSLGEEAFFIIGLHPTSSRASRRFKYPAIVFNPHAQFDRLRLDGQYEKMKNIVRRRDQHYSGAINPMLQDFGQASEAMQYTGRQYDGQWTCPLHSKHANSEDHSAAQ